MTVLSVVQDFCKLNALNVPTTVTGSTDTQVIQLFAIIREICEELVTESKFNVTTQEAIFSTVPTESQGNMEDLAPFGYQFAIFETFYDRTRMLPLIGPLNESEWQEIKALPSAGLMYKYRIRQNQLLFDPVPSASTPSDIAFEYMSSWCCRNSDGTLLGAIENDTDTFVFPENIIKKGLSFRFKQIKGLPYQADETQYYNLLNNYIAKDKVKRRINVSRGAPVDIQPGIFVPSSSWPVT